MSIPKPSKDFNQITLVEETGKYISNGPDALKYEWDPDKLAWFPMFDENLAMSQQSAYRVDGVNEDEPVVHITVKRKLLKANAEPKPVKALPKKNTSVYVTGLPLDTQPEEMNEVFSKYGVILEDIETGQPKIKLYKNEIGNLKGDALVIYYKEESVRLACQMLDEGEFRIGSHHFIRVQPAAFKNDKPIEKPTYSKNILKSKFKQLEKKFDWNEEKVNQKHKKTVILKQMFTREELSKDPTLLLDLKQEVRDESEKIGPVTSVILYENSDVGAMAVRFSEEMDANKCVSKMNNRYFSKRRIEAYIYDGKEMFNNLNEEDEIERMENYSKWIERDNIPDEEY